MNESFKNNLSKQQLQKLLEYQERLLLELRKELGAIRSQLGQGGQANPRYSELIQRYDEVQIKARTLLTEMTTNKKTLVEFVASEKIDKSPPTNPSIGLHRGRGNG